MNTDLVPVHSSALSPAESIPLPAVILDAGEGAGWRFLEFFTANIPNDNTRAAYFRAVGRFFTWCQARGLDLHAITPVHVAAYFKTHTGSVATKKQHLAALRMLFDYLVVGQVMPTNPAHAVKTERLVVRSGKTPVLTDGEVRALFESIPDQRVIDLRDRALVGAMFYTFGRIGAVVGFKVKDYVSLGVRQGLRLHEKGGNWLEVPVHHQLEEFLEAYLEAAGIRDDRDGVLFRAANPRRCLTERPLDRSYVFRMIRRRAGKVGIPPDRVSCHTFRATGITNYLSHGGTLEIAQRIAGHASPRTTKIYDRTHQRVEQTEIEKIWV